MYRARKNSNRYPRLESISKAHAFISPSDVVMEGRRNGATT
jgi:hypothetical protein